MGKQWKQCQTLFSRAPKSLQMVTAAMKLKECYLRADNYLGKKSMLAEARGPRGYIFMVQKLVKNIWITSQWEGHFDDNLEILNSSKTKVLVAQSWLSCVWLFATPWTIDLQENSWRAIPAIPVFQLFQYSSYYSPLSVEFSRIRILEWRVAIPFSRGIFLTQGLNPGLPHCRWILYQLSHQRL